MLSKKRSIFKRKKVFSFKSIIFSVFSLLLIVLGYAYLALSGSLPVIEGTKKLSGLKSSVVILRDKTGVVDISATNRLDLASALGYVHAQERFFQMDLARRNAAGELAALFGKKALPFDKRVQIHQFLLLAKRIFSAMPPEQQQHFIRYSEGVNQGLAQLKEKPFEYLLLRQAPREWKPHDSLLVVFSMYLTLQSNNGYREHLHGQLKSYYSKSVSQFLLPQGTEWDSPLMGKAYHPIEIPPPEQWPQSHKGQPPSSTANSADQNQASVESVQGLFLEVAHKQSDHTIGSNQWAVSGNLSQHSAAMLAGDMHLGLRVPNTWFRTQLHYQLDNKASVDLYGMTLPGNPLFIAGSNRSISWSFTNSYLDTSDLVKLTVNADKTSYLTPQGELPFEIVKQALLVDDAEIVEFSFKKTIWGPVVNHQGQSYAYRWIAHNPDSLNMGLLNLETAKTANEALSIARQTAIPTQNFMVADAHGHIGWTLIGKLPKRQGFSGQTPESWASGDLRWQGNLPQSAYPSILNPEGERLWTANARVVDQQKFAEFGDGGFALGARAKQISDSLERLVIASESDLLRIQLDDRARFLARWRKLMLSVLETSDDPKHISMKKLVANWSGHAAIDDAGYRLVKQFRLDLADILLTPLYTAPFSGLAVAGADSDANSLNEETSIPIYRQFSSQFEGPLWSLVSEQPDHLLPSGFSDWHQLFISQIEKELKRIESNEKSLEQLSWGSHNNAQIKHPLSRAVPLLSYFLDMPVQPLAGDRDMPRVQSSTFGASQRMVVSPGHEDEGIFQMPAGQSGHPLSPYYGAGHADWVSGRSSPFLMQSPVYKLMLTPGQGK